MVSPAPCCLLSPQKTVCSIAAHEGLLAALAFNASGSRLASASEKVSVDPCGGLSSWGYVAFSIHQRSFLHGLGGGGEQEGIRVAQS